ncbi:glycerophosphoryl diester phosphodiesterase [Propionibacterium cyclohexanicum]|uniref:Glycerophosphoryl diester phosphodiesterase n=1 Tax=Propionibacterium cyclohexanicum TaxID=64702 RepID=A0A1H9TEV5_9ACTN|nr:glycerophosphodiester phosphodiesterase family protein [Propionibacterium cyclohexanicum]SER95681.1 glycerophosphoryl diester phosphodiesterase [Propionibacterium cyclohexanicum]
MSSPRANATRFEYFDTPFAALAHRGGWDEHCPAPLENSLRAFEHAVGDLGYRYVETDVHATSDGVLIALHDEHLDRVTDRRGAVSELPFSQVRRALIGGTEPIPTMDEVFEALPQTRINIDIKQENAIVPLVDAIRRHRAQARVCVASFSPTRLLRFRRLMGPTVATAASMDAVAWSAYVPWLPRLINAGVQAFQIPRTQWIGPLRVPVLTAWLRSVARERDMRVHLWTVDGQQEMTELIDAGVDGIVSNRIDVLRRVVAGRGQWS